MKSMYMTVRPNEAVETSFAVHVEILFVAVFCAVMASALASRFTPWFMVLGTTAGSGAGVVVWWLTRFEPPVLRVIAVVLLSTFWSVVGGFLLACAIFFFGLVFFQLSFGG